MVDSCTKFILASLQSDELAENGLTVYSTLNENAKAVVRSAKLAVIRDSYVLLGIVVIGFFVIISIIKIPKNKNKEGKVIIRELKKRNLNRRNLWELKLGAGPINTNMPNLLV